MNTEQKTRFIQLADQHGYTAAVRLARDEFGPDLWESNAAKFATGAQATAASSRESQRHSAGALRHLHRRTARR